jgi:hypothetical protein
MNDSFVENVDVPIIGITNDNRKLNIDDIDFEKDMIKQNEDVFTWEPLSESWRKKLASENFVIKNCLGDGNCQFRSIETALTNAGCKTNHERLRQSLCKYINGLENSEFFDIIQNYRLEKQHGEFIGEWDPFTIKNKRDFTSQLKKPGFNFQGDNITLSLICKVLNVDIVILDEDLNITDLTNGDKPHPKMILLFFDRSKQHYKTLGLQTKRKRVITIFKRAQLPEEIERFLDKHNFYLHHIKDICAQELKCGKLQLNKIMKAIEERIQTHLSKQDKITIIKIIRMILDNEDFFNKIKSI